MLNGVYNVVTGTASGFATLAPIGGRVIYYAGTNLVLPAIYHVGLFVAQGIPCVLISGATWAATSSAGRFSLTTLAMAGVGYLYTSSPKSDEEKAADAGIWTKYSKEFKGLLGLLASFQIYNPSLIKSLYNSADASLFYVPSKIASLGGSAVSSLKGIAETTYISYITNPLKMYDLGAWAIAKGFVKAADYTHNKALDRAQTIQHYREIYGFETDFPKHKNAEAIKNGLLWIEKFNLDKESLFPDMTLMQDAGTLASDMSAAFTKFRTNINLTNLRELLTVAFKYPKLLAALAVGGMSALASGGIGSAITMVTGFASINKLSGIMWSGPAIVGVLHTPLLYIANYLPFTQPLLQYALVLTSESFLAYGSMALSAASIAVSITTISRSIIEVYWLNDNKKYQDAQNRDKQLNTTLYNDLQRIEFGVKDGKPAKLMESMTKDIYSVASEFLKFKEKDRSDYICAFAIKMLGVTKDTELIKTVMKAVMRCGVAESKQPEFIKDEGAMDNYLSTILNLLQSQPTNFDKKLRQPQEIQAPQARADSREKDGKLVLSTDEDDYLKLLDHGDTKASAAVQDLLQKLHHKAELENPSHGRG